MYEQHMPPPDGAVHRQDAIEIGDFVYAATGARVRRLTTPDGRHWFPAVDVAGDLGYSNTRQALRAHAPEPYSCSLQELVQGVYETDGLSKLAGHGLQKHMRMVSLEGLIRLVNGCTKRSAEAFKNWVTDVIVTIQREGSYALDKAEVQPKEPTAPTAYAMPSQVADAIVRLEEHNLRLDEEWLAQRREDRGFQREMLAQQSVMLAQQREIVALLGRIADSATPQSAEAPPQPSRPTAGAVSLLSLWERKQLAITKDVWPVAALMAGMLTSDGEARVSTEDIVTRTGLRQDQVLAALRLMLRHGCFRQHGVDSGGAQVYVLPGRNPGSEL
jgi:prophage antirepressor-like protein